MSRRPCRCRCKQIPTTRASATLWLPVGAPQRGACAAASKLLDLGPRDNLLPISSLRPGPPLPLHFHGCRRSPPGHWRPRPDRGSSSSRLVSRRHLRHFRRSQCLCMVHRVCAATYPLMQPQPRARRQRSGSTLPSTLVSTKTQAAGWSTTCPPTMVAAAAMEPSPGQPSARCKGFGWWEATRGWVALKLPRAPLLRSTSHSLSRPASRPDAQEAAM